MSKLTPPVNKKDNVQGSPKASITLVEYGDFQCPHCAAAHPVIKKIQKTFGDNLRFVFRHFPLANAHEWALPAAISAEAAGRQKKFWEMHDILFERQEELSAYAFIEFAQEIGLNLDDFKVDVQDEALAEKVESDFESGVRSGVNGTPSFFVNGIKYNGGYDFLSLSTALKENIQSVF